MKFMTNCFKFAVPFALCALTFGVTNANAGVKNLPLSISLTTVETLGAPVQPDGTPCPNGTAFGGQTAGTGTISIGSGKKIYSGPVFGNATDCATATLQFSNGKLTLIAANGDRLTATYYGSFMQRASGSTEYVINSGAFAITGGTGYFAGASGSGQLQGTENIPLSGPPFTGTLKAVGNISFSKNAFEQAYDMQQQ